MFYTAGSEGDPQGVQCQRPACTECALPTGRCPSYDVTSFAEKDYMRRVARTLVPSKLTSIGACTSTMIGRTPHGSRYADVYVEVSALKCLGLWARNEADRVRYQILATIQMAPDVVDVFVTDYSRNEETFAKDSTYVQAALDRFDAGDETRRRIRYLTVCGYVLKVAFKDSHWIETANLLKPAAIVRLSNLALRMYGDRIVGQVRSAYVTSEDSTRTKDLTQVALSQTSNAFRR